MRFSKITIFQKEKYCVRDIVSDTKSRMLPKQRAPITPQHGRRSVLGKSRIAKIDNHIAKLNKAVARSLGKRS